MLMLNLLELKRNNVSLILCTCDLLTLFIIPYDLLAEHAIFGVVTYTNLHFYMIIHYDKLCFGTALHVASLRTEKTCQNERIRVSSFLRDIFSFVRQESEKGRKVTQ